MKFCAKNLCKIMLSALFLLLFSGISAAQTHISGNKGNSFNRPMIAPSSVSARHIKDRAVTSAKIQDGTIQLEDMDPSIAGQIVKSTLTNAEQDRAIHNNAGKILALQTAVNGLSSGASDSADGVEITFARQFEYNTGAGGVPAIDLNGTALKINSNEPTVTLGGRARRVLASGDIPNTTPRMQQVIIDLPDALLAGNYKLKLSNARGNSEILVPLDRISVSFHGGANWTRATANAPVLHRRISPEVLSYNGKLWTMGGSWPDKNDVWSYKNDVWSSTDGVNWTQVTANAPWPGRHYFASTVYDNKMWIMGGSTHGNLFNDVWHSMDGANWTRTTASAGWPGRENFDAVSFKNKLWILVGSNNYARRYVGRSDVWSSSDGITWTKTADGAFTARYSPSALAFDNKLWIMGGFHGGRDVWSSPDGVNWTQATANAAWSGRSNASVVAYGGRMWLLGSYPYGTEVWSSADGSAWSLVTRSPGWHYRIVPAVVFNRSIWLVGGHIFGTDKSDVWHTSQ